MIFSVSVVATVTLLGAGLAAGARWVDHVLAKRKTEGATNAMRRISKDGKELITYEAQQYLRDIDRMTRR